MFLLQGFNGVEASGGVDPAVAGVFCGAEPEPTLSSDKDKVAEEEEEKKTESKETCIFSGNFPRFLVKSVYVALTLRRLTSSSLAAVCAENGSQ